MSQATAGSRGAIGRGLRRWPALPSARILAWAVFFGGWYLVSTYLVEPFILPPPDTIVSRMVEIVNGGQLWANLGISLWRLIQSFVVFFTVGTCLGVLMGLSKWWEEFLRDAMNLFISLPGLVFVLTVLLLLGLSPVSVILAVGLTVFPFVTIQVWEGVKAVPSELVEMGSSFHMRHLKVLRHIVVPALAPYLFAAATQSISLGWKLVVLSELFGSSSGIGYMMKHEFSRFSVAGVMAWAFFFVIISIFIDRVIVHRLDTWVFRWRR